VTRCKLSCEICVLLRVTSADTPILPLSHVCPSVASVFSLRKFDVFPLQQLKQWSATITVRALQFIRGSCEKFEDSPYYSESELSRGAVTVSFSKYLPWQAMHFLQRSTHFSKTCYRPLITSICACFGAPFSWLEKSRNRMGRDLDCMEDVLMEFHRSTFSKPNTEFNSNLAPCDFWAFPTMKRQLSAASFREVGGAL
jgi:hypothetical protein